MKKLFSAVSGLVIRAVIFCVSLWRRFRTLPQRTQSIVVVLIVGALGGMFLLSGKTATTPPLEILRNVSVRSVGALTLGEGSGSIFGSVRSMSEATIVAKSSGTVERVHTTLGASVPAGFVIAELENASERAGVLQAQGVYEATLASRTSTDSSGLNAYRAAYTTLDTALETYADTFYGSPGSYGPRFLLPVGSDDSIAFSKDRKEIRTRMESWQKTISQGGYTDPASSLSDAEAVAQLVSDLLVRIAKEANKTGSNASSAQLSALALARSATDTTRAAISAAQNAYRVGGTSSSADATVKQALGTLRLAEARLEQTRVRAPIGGTINFLPIRVGDYVTVTTPVATVAQNQALEIVAFVSEETRQSLSVGTEVRIAGTNTGIITSIAPALNPNTKQIEVRIAVTASPTLTNGASVQIEVPQRHTQPSTVMSPDTVLSLPLTAVKLRATDRVVFSVDTDNRLVAHTVTTGSVHGDRIEITSALPLELVIVTDARALAEGQQVTVSP